MRFQKIKRFAIRQMQPHWHKRSRAKNSSYGAAVSPFEGFCSSSLRSGGGTIRIVIRTKTSWSRVPNNVGIKSVALVHVLISTPPPSKPSSVACPIVASSPLSVLTNRFFLRDSVTLAHSISNSPSQCSVSSKSSANDGSQGKTEVVNSRALDLLSRRMSAFSA